MKICLITGASGGIGGAIAKVLATQYDTVLIQGRNIDKLNPLKAQIGEHCKVIAGDLNNSEDRQSVISQADQYGKINLLVNAAGISHFSSITTMSESDIENMITTNLVTPMLFLREFIVSQLTPQQLTPQKITPQAKTVDTAIVNVGSAFGYIGYPGFSSYCASKFGLRGFTESLAREYSDSNIRFAYFAPRATKTDINTNTVDKLNTALGNSVDSPEDVAQQFDVFLKSSKRQMTVGWPEKLFVKINALFPKLVDNAIKSKLVVIQKFLNMPR